MFIFLNVKKMNWNNFHNSYFLDYSHLLLLEAAMTKSFYPKVAGLSPVTLLKKDSATDISPWIYVATPAKTWFYTSSIKKAYYSYYQHSQKLYSLYKFSSKKCCLCKTEKKHFHCIISRRPIPVFLNSTWKANVCIFL